MFDLQCHQLKLKDLSDSELLRKCYGATKVLRNATDCEVTDFHIPSGQSGLDCAIRLVLKIDSGVS